MAVSKFQRNHLIGLLIALVAFFIIGILLFSAPFERMELGATNFMFYIRDPGEYQDPGTDKKGLPKGVEKRMPNKNARKDIIIVGIDESTIRHFSDQGIQWPFPWDIHSQLIKYIGSGEPLAILYDIMFLDHKKGENKLAAAIKEAKNVFLDFPFELKEVGKDYSDQAERLELLNRLRFPFDPDDPSHQLVAEAAPPTPLLTHSSRGIGFANVFYDPDNIIRAMPLLIKWNGWYYPNIDLVVIMHYFGIGKNDMEIKWGKYIKLKNLPSEKMAKPNPQREIVIPIDNKGAMDINYIGGMGSFQNYPFRYFCRDGNMLKENNTSLKDKILLVAAYDVTGFASEEKQSPYGATFGIDHHANAINTILNQNFLYKFTDFQNIIVMFVMAILLGLVVPRISIILSLVFTSLLSIMYIVGTYLAFHFYSYIPSFITPVIQSGVTFMLIVTYRVLTEQKEKKFIKQTFSKFVSQEVVEELLKSPEKLKLGGERKIVTVLFSDIRGFTSISERTTPEKLVDHLNHYLQAMTDIVIKYDGTLDKYVGDEIMAFWGAPIPQEDHAVRACRAAAEMISKLNDMNLSWKAEKKDTLNIGIGVNTGAMIVGFVGSSSRMDYTLMGDMVNLGARLEGTNKIYKTNIIISEFTYEQVKEQVIARELDLIRVKGKELPVKIYELIDVKNT
jgi:adenylate cyclase